MRYSSLHNCEHFVIRELLSSRKGTRLQEIKMDLSRENEKAIGVFVSGSETKQLGWTISEVERMGQMELKISHNFQGERNFISF